ncbi:helix-turn-helix domain-containing protein [Streptomyces sp. NPDC058611]|uniref:helix-turn-helix domain-containing protein n=1 Tax=unclassified Streptomyces TaxID=2593676 RepID=UPI00364F05E2
MGRPEKPVWQPDRPPGLLALGLRSARGKAGVNYADLAETTSFSRQTLQRAASGKGIPDRAVVEAYARGCQTDPRPLVALWKKARIDKEQRSRGPGASAPPAVQQVRDRADLGAALKRLHVRAGAPSFRDIAKRTAKNEGVVKISKTTAHLIIVGQRFPSSLEQMRALLVAYSLPEHSHALWLAAWSRANAHNEAERAKENRKREIRRGPARARRDRLKGLLATSAPGVRDADTDAYVRDTHQARQDRSRTASPDSIADLALPYPYFAFPSNQASTVSPEAMEPDDDAEESPRHRGRG